MGESQQTVLGIDVGGTKILIGRITRDGLSSECKRYPMDRSTQDSALKSIWQAVDSYIADTQHLPQPVMAGLGLVGKVDSERGVWVSAVNIPIRHSVEIAKEFQERYDLNAALANDVHAATIAEMRLGAGQQWSNFVYINVGTGIAAGIVNNRQLLLGSNFSAGEIGHMIVGSEEVRCKCGQTGCLEMLASGGDMIAHVKKIAPDYPSSTLQPYIQSGVLSVKHIFQAAQSGDALSEDMTKQAVKSLGQAIINISVMLDTEGIILGGGLFQNEWFYEQLLKYVQDHSGLFAKSAKNLQLSTLDPKNVGLLGAGCVAWRKHEQQLKVRSLNL
ncbi:ROK family protein [Lederbergia panacisoli]|uniref:ROK family protein n=1 Tax=Lederbergia panacisoli TaxID=1255251 RepID=UPI00214B4797|nr:ROK family protein [Lederbergia panacisoli]MCR2822977.1 ROK family protein [Lederbergia panacisoli]